MATPNIILANTIIGKTTLYNANSVMTQVLSNANGSNQLIKLNSVMYANANANNIPCYVEITRGGLSYNLAGSVTVPGYSSLVVVAKDTSTYLEEGDGLRCNTGGGMMGVTISYEVIS
jgi:hypothetical protein